MLYPCRDHLTYSSATHFQQSCDEVQLFVWHCGFISKWIFQSAKLLNSLLSLRHFQLQSDSESAHIYTAHITQKKFWYDWEHHSMNPVKSYIPGFQQHNSLPFFISLSSQFKWQDPYWYSKKRYKQIARAPKSLMLWTLLAPEMDKYFPPEHHHTLPGARVHVPPHHSKACAPSLWRPLFSSINKIYQQATRKQTIFCPHEYEQELCRAGPAASRHEEHWPLFDHPPFNPAQSWSNHPLWTASSSPLSICCCHGFLPRWPINGSSAALRRGVEEDPLSVAQRNTNVSAAACSSTPSQTGWQCRGQRPPSWLGRSSRQSPPPRCKDPTPKEENKSQKEEQTKKRNKKKESREHNNNKLQRKKSIKPC